MARTADSFVIRRTGRQILPDRSLFLSGLTSNVRPESMRSLAQCLIDHLGADDPLRRELVSAAEAGDADFVFAVASRMQPGWGVTFADARSVVVQGLLQYIRDGKIKAAHARWAERMGGSLMSGPLIVGPVDLRRSKLANRDLTSFVFAGTDLGGSNMAKSKISRAPNARFDGVHGDGMTINGDIGGASFAGASLVGAKICTSRTAGLSFARANLTDAFLHVSNREIVSLSDVDLQGANVANLNIQPSLLLRSSWWNKGFNKLRGSPRGFSRVKTLRGEALILSDAPSAEAHHAPR